MAYNKKSLSLYIHIPFCHEKCFYCDFLSFTKPEAQYSQYVDHLIWEIKEKAPQYTDSVKSIFIGGGTPTVLSITEIQRILEAVTLNFKISPDCEWTIEANPESSSYNKLAVFRTEGVNRISFGLQAWQNRLLKAIGRIHTKEMFLEAYYNARSAGFENINIDLMFSLPGQSEADWIETLESICRLNPEHISCYSLMIEENTIFDTMIQKNSLTIPDETQDRSMYHLIPKFLSGYEKYEISNFSKPGFSCRHNLVYWQGGNYLGLGLGAHSLIDGLRYHNTEDFSHYLQGNYSKQEMVYLSLKDQMAEFMFLRLRLTDGFTEQEFYNQFHISIWDIYKEELNKMFQYGLLDYQKQLSQITLTSKGIDLSNQVFVEFI